MSSRYRVTEKGITWRRKGETAEVWVGKGRARIFEYFEKTGEIHGLEWITAIKQNSPEWNEQGQGRRDPGKV